MKKPFSFLFYSSFWVAVTMCFCLDCRIKDMHFCDITKNIFRINLPGLLLAIDEQTIFKDMHYLLWFGVEKKRPLNCKKILSVIWSKTSLELFCLGFFQPLMSRKFKDMHYLLLLPNEDENQFWISVTLHVCFDWSIIFKDNDN